MKIARLPFFILALVGCSLSAQYDHIDKITMDANAAPEIRGADGFYERNGGKFRASASLHLGEAKSEKISDANTNAAYQINYPYITVSLDYLIKNKILLWGWNATIDKGLFANYIAGFNKKNFEAGISIGLWLHKRDFEYSGTEYTCSDSSNEIQQAETFTELSSWGFAVTYGGYASVYHGPFSLSYSVNIYRPIPAYKENTESQIDLPFIMTEYISAAYRLNKNWKLRLGATNTFGGFPGWHWGIIGGLSYHFTKNPLE